MRAFRFAFVALAVAGLAVSTLDSSFARGNGAPGGPGAGAGGAGGSSGASGAGALGGGGSNPQVYAIHRRDPAPYGLPIPDRSFSASCAKQEPLYNRYGVVVAHAHGADCEE